MDDAMTHDPLFEPSHDRRQLMAAIMALTGTALLPASVFAQAGTKPQPEEVGAVGYLKGSATATRLGAVRDLADRAALFATDEVSTKDKTRMMITLGKRTTLRLGDNATVSIAKYMQDAGGDIDLVAGAIQFERTGPPANTELRFKSPYGLIAVRGTRFFAGPSKGVFGVLVGSGRVVVTSGGASVELRPGQGTDIARPGARPTAPANWGYPRVKAALASIR